MLTDLEIIMAVVNNDCMRPSDAIILLEGDGFHRFQKAVDLYKEGLGRKIVFSGAIVQKEYGSYPFDEVKPLILKAGVPEDDLIYEDKSLHTRQQAIEVVKMAMANGWKKLALVASSEHQYRAYLTFLREVLDSGSGIALYNVPVRNLDWFVNDGWGIRFDRLKAEVERIEKYSAMGHLANAEEVIEYQKWKESLL